MTSLTEFGMKINIKSDKKIDFFGEKVKKVLDIIKKIWYNLCVDGNFKIPRIREI